MAVRSYSIKQFGKTHKLSHNFTLGELQSKCGHDMVLVDDDLILLLQKIRDHFKEPVTINSGYRTEAHNMKIGGSPNSQHKHGKAADVIVRNVTPLQVAQFAESQLVSGIGHYPAGQGNFCHVDVRDGFVRWEQRNGREVAVAGFGGTPDYAFIVQQKTGFNNDTMNYLKAYKYQEAMFEKLAKAMR